jgi:hypothetical protein
MSDDEKIFEVMGIGEFAKASVFFSMGVLEGIILRDEDLLSRVGEKAQMIADGCVVLSDEVELSIDLDLKESMGMDIWNDLRGDDVMDTGYVVGVDYSDGIDYSAARLVPVFSLDRG